MASNAKETLSRGRRQGRLSPSLWAELWEVACRSEEGLGVSESRAGLQKTDSLGAPARPGAGCPASPVLQAAECTGSRSQLQSVA